MDRDDLLGGDVYIFVFGVETVESDMVFVLKYLFYTAFAAFTQTAFNDDNGELTADKFTGWLYQNDPALDEFRCHTVA